ncbi:uncharacterized protein LOC143299803 isoform X2 [Babylonia areolata]|uniref:uncharacterized protein LOC143299803 isoform X2 n=1 Tax=Babylonia areolata TaxID=304850 RepID=UPI003FD072DD
MGQEFVWSLSADNVDGPRRSSWKFWRKLSTRRPDRKSRWSAKSGAHVTADITRPRDLDLRPAGEGEGDGGGGATSGSLPDVVDKAVLTRTTSLKAPPPKPPRLFLCRSSSLNLPPGPHLPPTPFPLPPTPFPLPPTPTPFPLPPTPFPLPPTSLPLQQVARRGRGEEEEEPIYVNSAFGAALKSGLSGNDRIIPPPITPTHHHQVSGGHDLQTRGQNRADSTSTVTAPDRRERSGEVRGRGGEGGEGPRQHAASPTDTLPRPPRPSSTLTLSSIYYSLPHRPKARGLPAHPPKARPRGSGREAERRHQVMLHSVVDVLCQRWDPFPLLLPLHHAGVLSALDLQAFSGHPDRQLIVENVLNVVGNGDLALFTAFLAVLREEGGPVEVVGVLEAMRDVDSVIHDLPGPESQEEGGEGEEGGQVLAEEKILSFEVGFRAADGVSLRPVVELDRARRTSPSAPPGATDPGGQPWGAAEVAGPVMVNVCVTGHALSGPRALALAQVLRQHDSIQELRIGKTQLGSADVAALCGALRHNSSLTSLDLRLNWVKGVGASAVASVLTHGHSLQSLNLSSTGMEAEGFREVLTALTSNRTLTHLDLSFLNVGDVVCEVVRDMLRANSTLRRLRLRSSNFSAKGVAVLAEGLSRNRTLQELDLSRNSLGDAGIGALARHIPESALCDVSLENCHVTAGACGALCQMVAGSRGLRSVDLSVNPLGDEGVQGMAAALERSSVLQCLALNMCGVTNTGLATLLDVLEKNTSIRLLKLCYNHLGQEHPHSAPSSDDLRYRLRIVTSSQPTLKILLWGNSFSQLEAQGAGGTRRFSSLR